MLNYQRVTLEHFNFGKFRKNTPVTTGMIFHQVLFWRVTEATNQQRSRLSEAKEKKDKSMEASSQKLQEKNGKIHEHQPMTKGTSLFFCGH
jgi:hypothetical protein